MTGMAWYLCLEHHPNLRGEVRAPEYVGPFLTAAAAKAHRQAYGPRHAAITVRGETPTDGEITSPAEHIDYLKARE